MAATSSAEQIAAYEAQLGLEPEKLAQLRAGRLALEQEAIVNAANAQRDGSSAAEERYCAAKKELGFQQRVIYDLARGGFLADITVREYDHLEREYIARQIAALNSSSLEG